ncbi:hypothetical protein EDB85DRAFT_1982560 [Lactarius pseudohatsudake]|nr:hypothetical protein EDB85DRAFT_1982560 [Lactarius pseudohatsudake]
MVNIVKTHAKVRSVASQLMGRTNGLQSVQLERVLRMVDSHGSVIDRDEGIQGQKVVLRNVVKPEDLDEPTSDDAFFLPSRLRSNTSPPHVTEILAPTQTEEPMKVYNLPILNTTPEFTKMLALVSSMGLNPDHPR